MSKIILLCVFSHAAGTAVGLCTPASPQTHEECVLLQGSRGCNATRPQEFLSSLIISQKNCCMCNLLLFVSVAAWLAPFPPSLRSLSFCVWARRAFLSHSLRLHQPICPSQSNRVPPLDKTEHNRPTLLSLFWEHFTIWQKPQKANTTQQDKH